MMMSSKIFYRRSFAGAPKIDHFQFCVLSRLTRSREWKEKAPNNSKHKYSIPSERAHTYSWMICCRRARRNHIVNSRVEAAERNDQRQMLLSTWKPSVIIISWKPIFFMLHWQRGDDRIIQFIQCDYYILYRCVVCNLCVLYPIASKTNSKCRELNTLQCLRSFLSACSSSCRHDSSILSSLLLLFLPSSLAHSAKCVWKCFIKLTQTISHLRPALWHGGGKWQTWWNEKEKLISTAMVILMIVTYWVVLPSVHFIPPNEHRQHNHFFCQVSSSPSVVFSFL